MGNPAEARVSQRSSQDDDLDLSDWTDSSEEIFIKATKTRWYRPHRSRFSDFDLRSFTTHPLGFRLFRRPARRLRPLIFCLNFLSLVLVSLTLLSFFDALFHPSYSNPPAHYLLLEEQVQFSSHAGRGNPHGEKVFIAANIINAEFIRGGWGKSMLRLVHLLGPENVFISIYDNDSGSETSAALAELARTLTCDYSITTGDHLPLIQFPSIVTPTGETRVKRLTYLHEVRNRLLRPLDEPSAHPSSNVTFTHTRFDRILFVNDVHFDPMDALHLLFSTNIDPVTHKPDYRAACAMDFVYPIIFYDSFVVRDSNGYETGLPTFPWFTTAEDAKSRNAVLAESDAVPVRSCWGGMAAYQADEFLRPEVRETPVSVIHSTFKHEAPLRFRHQPEMFWEESECCLVNADLAHRTDPTDPKIFVNPYIRVAYSAKTRSWLPFFRRIERGFSILQFFASKAFYPEFNPRRTETPDRSSSQMRWVFDDEELNGEKMRDLTVRISPERLKGQWKLTNEIARGGGFCGQRRLFAMKQDLEAANKGRSGKNWEKVVPPR